jgi:hypothetical protein
MFPNRWEYLKFYNINDVKIMISPIDNLMKMFFKWKVDILANITLASIVQLFMPFSSYYLWYLIDRFGFVIDDLTEMLVFYGNDNGLFTKFTIQLMEERIKAIEQKNDGYGTFCKNILNAAYGKDGMNKSKYSKLVIMNQKKVFFSQCLPEFKGFRAISNNRYIVEKNYKTYSVNTAIQEAVFTLDNAKFWYIKFVYDFIYRCIDLSKIHFIEGDRRQLILCNLRKPR